MVGQSDVMTGAMDRMAPPTESMAGAIDRGFETVTEVKRGRRDLSVSSKPLSARNSGLIPPDADPKS
jgi:hypothetical protein